MSDRAAAVDESENKKAEEWVDVQDCVPLKLFMRSFSAFARFELGRELARMLRLSDSIVSGVDERGEVEDDGMSGVGMGVGRRARTVSVRA